MPPDANSARMNAAAARMLMPSERISSAVVWPSTYCFASVCSTDFVQSNPDPPLSVPAKSWPWMGTNSKYSRSSPTLPVASAIFACRPCSSLPTCARASCGSAAATAAGSPPLSARASIVGERAWKSSQIALIGLYWASTSSQVFMSGSRMCGFVAGS